MPPKSAVPCCNCGVNLPPRRAKGPNSGILRRRGIKSRVNTTDTALEVLTREFGFQESEYDAELWLCPNCFAAVKTLAQGRKVFTDRACIQSIFEVAKPSENVSPKSKEKDSEPPQKKQKKKSHKKDKEKHVKIPQKKSEKSEESSKKVTKKMLKKEKKKKDTRSYKDYPEKNMRRAYYLVMHKKKSITRAAIKCGVPARTLGARVRKGTNENVEVGHPTLFTKEEEERMATFAQHQASIGYELTSKKLIELASHFAIKTQKEWIKTKNHKSLSLHWVNSFIKRWPNIHLLKLSRTKVSVAKLRMTSPEVIALYYKELEQILEKHELKDKPERIYNLDETSFVTDYKPPSPFRKQNKEQRESMTTVIATSNAIGNALPPFFVISGQKWHDNLGKGAFPGAGFKVTESGKTTTELLEYFLKEHFMKCVPQDDKPNLLLYDGHTSNIGIKLIEYAKKKKIILFVIPPHSSRLLQPADALDTKPLNTAFDQIAQDYLEEHPGTAINRYNICQLISQAYSSALTPENIISNFQNSGLVTLSPFPCESGSLLASAITAMQEEIPKVTE